MDGFVPDVGDLAMDQIKAPHRVLANPQAMVGRPAEPGPGNVHFFKSRMGKRALSPAAAGRHNGQPAGDAVVNGDLADREARYAAAIQADLERTAPSPTVIIAATAHEFAVADQRRSAEIVVDLKLLIGGRKASADQNAASSGDVGKETVLDAVVRSAIDRPAIGKKGQLTRAVTDNIVARPRALLHEALV